MVYSLFKGRVTGDCPLGDALEALRNRVGPELGEPRVNRISSRGISLNLGDTRAVGSIPRIAEAMAGTHERLVDFAFLLSGR